MAYTKQTWVNNDATTPLSATRLNYIEQGIADAHALAASGGSSTTATPRLGIVPVASSQLPQSVKDGVAAAGGFVCSGTNDQVQINAALLKASRPADGFGGEGHIGVQLIGPRFFTASGAAATAAGSITMYPSTHLMGTGPGTIITPGWSTNAVDRGCIELLNANTAHVRVSSLTIGAQNAVTIPGHGIRFVQSGQAAAYEYMTGSDTFHYIDHVSVLKAARSGIYLTGTAGGNRETQISWCLLWQCQERGVFFDGSSDCQISDCRGTGGGNFPRFELGGGNVKIANCKAYFSGNQDANDGPTADGFLINSSRVSVVGCDAQDNGRYGFNFTGNNATASGLVADSNSRGTATGGGFFISSAGMYSGMHAHNRPQNAITQNRPFIFSGAPKIYLTGRSELSAITGTGTHVTGAPTGYVRILKDGDAGAASDGHGLYSVG
jgi:hypothetical protein